MKLRVFITATGLASILTAALAGQSVVRRTPDGHPDLQGVWDYATITPLERPQELGDKQFYTASEAEEFERGASDRDFKKLPADEQTVNADLVGDLATGDRGHLDAGRRTALIVSPKDGRIPFTPEVKALREARRSAAQEPPDGPEALRLSDRCLHVDGPPLTPNLYNNNIQIVQTADYVLLATEMIHDARIVPLDGRPHLPETIRKWDGDSRGRWDGDTLVIDTTNFTNKTRFAASTAALHLVERLTRIGERSLLYEFSIEDPGPFTKPWSGALTIRKNDALMYEFACHEGNYSLVGMLRGARAGEKAK